MSMSACNSESDNNLSKQNNDLLQSTAKPNESPTISETQKPNETTNTQNSSNPIKSDELTENNEVFFGEWVIKSQIASGRVSEYGDEEIKKLLGKKLNYSSNLASYDNNVLKMPYYEKSTINEKDFFIGNYVSFEQLGIKSKSIVKVEVYTNKELNKPWDCIGRMLFVKNDNILILYDGGIYFELDRVK